MSASMTSQACSVRTSAGSLLTNEYKNVLFLFYFILSSIFDTRGMKEGSLLY